MDNIFIQLAIILGLSSFLGFLTKLLNLPILIAYLFGGLLLSLTSVFNVTTSPALHFLPEIGTAFMLFLVGMELDLREIKSLGKPIALASIIQIFITTILGSSMARILGFGVAESWYLGVGLSFSSTVVIVKLLYDRKELTSLYGKLSLGISLLEDLLAVVILLVLTVAPSTFNLGLSGSFPVVTLIFKIIILFGLAILLNRFALPKIFEAVSDSSELLFLTSLSWCFIFVSFAAILGFSVLIGAFLAGVTMASSVYHFQIQGKVKPLRDFFVALFFVYLGTKVNFADLSATYPLIIVFTLYALIIKPIIIILLLGIFGFRKHTMFLTAINLSQISEFSLILMLVGLQKSLVSSSALTAIALTAVISMIISSVMITHSKKIYRHFSKVIGFFERKNFNHAFETLMSNEPLEGHVVVVGGHRMGGEIVKMFKKEKIPQIILDFNPNLVKALLALHVPVVYGDMGDPEVLSALNLKDARMVISTAPNLDDNKLLLEQLKGEHKNIPVVVRAENIAGAESLYKAGADFVIIPEILAGDYLVEKLKDHMSGKYFQDRTALERERLSKKTLSLEFE